MKVKREQAPARALNIRIIVRSYQVEQQSVGGNPMNTTPIHSYSPNSPGRRDRLDALTAGRPPLPHRQGLAPAPPHVGYSCRLKMRKGASFPLLYRRKGRNSLHSLA